jgi:hypothetical protein
MSRPHKQTSERGIGIKWTISTKSPTPMSSQAHAIQWQDLWWPEKASDSVPHYMYLRCSKAIIYWIKQTNKQKQTTSICNICGRRLTNHIFPLRSKATHLDLWMPLTISHLLKSEAPISLVATALMPLIVPLATALLLNSFLECV